MIEIYLLRVMTVDICEGCFFVNITSNKAKLLFDMLSFICIPNKYYILSSIRPELVQICAILIIENLRTFSMKMRKILFLIY